MDIHSNSSAAGSDSYRDNIDGSYFQLLIKSYEEEIAGASYFRALCDLFPERTDFLKRCVELEINTAAMLYPLIQKYQLNTKLLPILQAEGSDNALLERHKSWSELMQESIDFYPTYVDEFKALESMAPTEDRIILEKLTAHEIVLINWMKESR